MNIQEILVCKISTCGHKQGRRAGGNTADGLGPTGGPARQVSWVQQAGQQGRCAGSNRWASKADGLGD